MNEPGFENVDHPRDTALSAALRFLTELIAWIAGPWAAAAVSVWLAVPVLVVLIGLPSVFSTPGDKRKVIVATPGPVRASIELVLFLVAAIAPWLVWGPWLAAGCSAIAVAALISGWARLRWLIGGAQGSC